MSTTRRHFLGAAAGIAAAWLWWRSTAPRVARLLPEADGYFYVDLATLRHAGAVDQLPPVSEDPGYRDFIEATGFRFERDIDSAAFAIHGHTVAVSNADSDAPLHTILDKFSGRSLARSAPMLREFYGEVPVGSLVWLIVRVYFGSA